MLGYDAIEIGLAFLPVSLGIGVLSLVVSARLSLRFGARPVLLAGLTLIRAGWRCSRAVPVDGDYVVDLLPSMLLLGVGAGLVVPAAHDARHVGGDAAATPGCSPASSTRRSRSAARSASPCSPRSRRRARESCSRDGDADRHRADERLPLAFAIGAGFVIAAIAVAVRAAPAGPRRRRPLEPAYREA